MYIKKLGRFRAPLQIVISLLI